MAVRPAVKSSRVEVLGSIIYGIGMVSGNSVAGGLGNRDLG